MTANARAVAPRTPHARRISVFWQGVACVLTGAGVLVGLSIVFNPGLLRPLQLSVDRYLFLVLGIFLALVFLLFPGRARDLRRVPWYDAALAGLALAIGLYLVWNARQINAGGWALARAPDFVVAVGVGLWLLVLEAARRTTGNVFAGIILVVSLYPSYAGAMPGPLRGFDIPFVDTVRFHAFSGQSITGDPLRVLGTILMGFLVFGVVLQHTGGGQFFADLAGALLGPVRGGTAKVAIVASGAFGMLSGSGVSNVLSTGTVTIPAMKQSGFTPAFAAGVEANAANGGTLVPPVMGATAFLMATILEEPYSVVALAAVVPALLFYYSLFVQLDAYAARYGIRGVERAAIPALRQTLRTGWPYLLTLGLLVSAVLQLRADADAAFVCAGVLLVAGTLGGRIRWSLRSAVELVIRSGRVLAELTSQLAAVGMLIGSLYLTGSVASFTSGIIHFGGTDVVTLLALAAVVSLILGTGLPDTAAYIFLAVMLAPALVAQGFDPVAVHFFILYWSNIADVTPPVAIAVTAAAGIAQAPAMASMWEATRLAAVKYLLPFYFVLNPVLLFRGFEPVAFAQTLVPAVIGITVAAYALQGYLPGVGVVTASRAGLAVRAAMTVGALLLAVPAPALQAGGWLVMAVGYGLLWVAGRRGWRMLVAVNRTASHLVQPQDGA
ncbi:MAG: TRAP transporter fused permease subunit [Dehalococcoidia bacterium]|nr:TRAP transporter fused permease subunit [Dehalococcoidia bacterium]